MLGALEPLLDVTDGYFDTIDRAPYDQAFADRREQLNTETLSIAWAAGRAMTLAQAITYALDQLT